MLEHCELAWGGQCCLACPKKLSDKISRRNAAQKIDAFIEVLKNVKERKKSEREKEGNLPNGICVLDGSRFKIYISHNNRQVWLGSSEDLGEAISIRAAAEEAKKKGVFDEWYGNLCIEREKRNKAKRTAKKGR